MVVLYIVPLARCRNSHTMPQFLLLSPDEIAWEYADGEIREGGDMLDTGVTIEEAVQGVLDGTMEPKDIPMVEVERHSGQWYCMDYRPLAVFRRLHQVGQCKNIKVKVVKRRGQGHGELADEINDLKITVGQKGNRTVAVQHEEVGGNGRIALKEETTQRERGPGKKTQDDSSLGRGKMERPKSSLGRSTMSKSVPSSRRAATLSTNAASSASPTTRRSQIYSKSIETQNGHSGRRSGVSHTSTPSRTSASDKPDTKAQHFVRFGSGRGSSANSNFKRAGSGRGTGIISSFVRSGSGRGSAVNSNCREIQTGSERAPGLFNSNLNNKATKPSTNVSRENGVSSRLSSASFGGGETQRKRPIPKAGKVMSNSHSSTSTNSSNGPDEPRTLSEQELLQGSESDDEMLFVFDGHGNNQRLPIDMLAKTDRNLRTLNHRCWKCRKYFQSKQELWIHKKQVDH